MLKVLTGVCLLIATPASAFVIAHLAGSATTRGGTQPASFQIITGFTDRLFPSNLPQPSIGDLSNYTLGLTGDLQSTDPQTPTYAVTGGVRYDGQLIQQLIPVLTWLNVDPITSNANFFLRLNFDRPLSSTDFRVSNGYYVQGRFTLMRAVDAPFAGEVIVPIIDPVTEPGIVALFGLTALGLVQTRRR